MAEVKEIRITSEEFQRAMERAKQEIASWPAWKRETRASSISRPVQTSEEKKRSDEEYNYRILNEIEENNKLIKDLQSTNKLLRSFIKE